MLKGHQVRGLECKKLLLRASHAQGTGGGGGGAIHLGGLHVLLSSIAVFHLQEQSSLETYSSKTSDKRHVSAWAA